MDEFDKWRNRYKVPAGELSIKEYRASLDNPKLGKQLEERARVRGEEQQAKRRVIEDAVISRGLDSGRSFEDISLESGLDLNRVKKYAESTRPGYGVKKSNVEKAKDVAGKVGGVVKDVGYDVVGRPLSNFSGGLVSAVTAGNEQDLIAEGQSISQKAYDTYTKQYREGKISKERYQKLTEDLDRWDDDLIAQSDEIEKRANPAKFAGAGAELALAAGGGLVAKAGKAAPGIARGLGMAEGAGLGAAATAQQEGADAEDILTGAGVGGALGAVVPGAVGAVTKAVKGTKDFARIQASNNLASLVDQEIAKIDDELMSNATAISKRRLNALNRDKAFLEGEVSRDLTAKANEEVLDTGNRRVAGQAESIESQAVKDGLVKEIGDKAEYGATDWGYQADRAVQIMDEDFDQATRIALGQEAPPSDVLVNSVVKGVEQRALEEGNAELITQLAQSPVTAQTSRAAQELGVLASRDPNSPVDAIKALVKARTNSKTGVKGIVSSEESQKIVTDAKALADARRAVLTEYTPENARAYGKARIQLDNYVNGLVHDSHRPTVKSAIDEFIGLPKSIVSTLDNSVIGRQGWKTLMTSPKVWAKNSLKSFEDIARTFGGKEVLDETQANIVSRKNALNGLYDKADLAVYGTGKQFAEEAYPTSFGKLAKNKAGKIVLTPFRASEEAFSGWQQRARADLFDWYIDDFAKKGGDINNSKEVKAIGQMVNALTSRGKLPKDMERAANTLNKLFFSPRLLKSNIDVLGGHILTGAGGSNYVRKRAARNLVKIAVGSATALKLASAATGGKIETDPRSSDFGKLRIGDTRHDLTGGMAGLVTLGSRLLPTMNDDEWGFFTKSSSTGNMKKLNEGGFGDATAEDVLLDFLGNKLSPTAAAVRDIYRGKDFDGNRPTIASTAKNLTMPLIVQQYSDLKNARNPGNIVATMISEGLGVGTSTYGLESNWNANNSKRVTGFKDKVSPQAFKKAEETFNNQFQEWYDKVSDDERFWKLPLEQRETIVTSKKDTLTDDVLKQYGYEYKTKKKSDEDKKLAEELKKY